MPARFLLAVCSAVCLVVAFVGDARAQFWPSSPLDPWLQTVRIGMLDQRSGYGGLLSDRGSTAYYTPRMDHEYHIDLRTAGYDPWHDDGWAEGVNGLRSYAGSIDRSAFATITDIRHRERLSSRQAFSVLVRQQDDLSARRLFLEVGYDVNLTGRHVLGIRHTGGGSKPDLDVGVHYRADLRAAGFATASLTFLDYANNFIFDVLGTDPALDDTTRSYSRIPVLIETRWISPLIASLSLEVAGGILPASHATIEHQHDSSFDLRTRHAMRYGAVQAKYRIHPFELGVAHQSQFEARAFFSPAGSSAGRSFEARQAKHRARAFVSGSWPVRRQHDLRVVFSADRVAYEDRQSGSDFREADIPEAFHLVERRWETTSRLHLLPLRRGLRGGITLLTDHRDYRAGMDVLERHFLMFRQWSPNHRASVHAGYQVRPGAFIEIGASIDLDGDDFYTDGRGLTRFDGGFGRLQVTW